MYNIKSGGIRRLLSKISEATLIPVSLLAIILSISVGGAWWMSALYARVVRAEDNVSDLQASQKEVIEELKVINTNLVEIKIVLKAKREFKKWD